MSMQKATLIEVNRVAAEVANMAEGVARDLDDQNARYVGSDLDGYVAETPDGGIATAALRRRSMDLTRLLAEMRKS